MADNKRPPAINYKEPVYITNGENQQEIRYLAVNKSYDFDSAIPAKEILKDDDPVYVPFYQDEIQKENVWACRKCGAWDHYEGKPETCKSCSRVSRFDVINPKVNPNIWKLPKYKKTKFDPSEMITLYHTTLDLLHRTIIFPEEIHYKIFTLWAFSTWKIEQWDTVGFLIFTGEIDSGKTRGLDLLSYLGYRMMQTAGVTFPAMVRATHYHNAGILIDEAHNKLRSDTEYGREMIDFIKPSYRRGSHYTVADKDDQTQIVSYNNFGFKAFAGEKSIVDRGFLSRSIPFIMEKDYPEITKLKYVQDDLEEIQRKLLFYRIYADDPPELPQDYELKGRIREIFESIIRTGKHIGLDTSDIVSHAKTIINEQEEELQDTLEHSVLKAIRENATNETLDDAPEEIRYSDILHGVWGDDVNGKEKRKLSIKLGFCISKSLQLKHKRKTKGNVILLNDKNTRRLSYLYRRYGLVKT